VTCVVSVPMQADRRPRFSLSAVADQASEIQLTLPTFTPLQDTQNGGYPAFGTAGQAVQWGNPG
jgi:hypothetical protein